MKVHDLVLITQLLGKLEKKAHLERAIFSALLSFSFRFFVLAKSIETACLIDVNLLVCLATLDKFVVD